MFSVVRSLYRYRSLLAALTGRELKARYRGSVLGYVWSLANPLLLLAVYTFVFSYIFDPRDPDVAPYGLFLITGLFPWIWFQTALTEGAAAMQANAGLIRKATFPSELLPIVSVLANLVHFAFALPVMALAFVFFRYLGHDVGGWTAVLLPLIVALQLPMVGGLTLGLAALNAHFKDVKDILNNLLTLLFFMTPILYTMKTISEYRPIYWLVSLNPLTPFMQAYQQVLFFHRVPDLEHWLMLGAISALSWIAGTWVFERLRETLVEAI